MVSVKSRCGLCGSVGGGGGGWQARDSSAVSNDNCFLRIPRRFALGLEVDASLRDLTVTSLGVGGDSELVVVVVLRMLLIAGGERAVHAGTAAGAVGFDSSTGIGSVVTNTTTLSSLHYHHQQNTGPMPIKLTTVINPRYQY